ncbi:hypothetical protein O7635_08895 [Asanoa sp. WMMD1127]|uniref:hypothetical protein n=1 Tax=Asanoa sp. WMMD1127 TaxID=3016107 RepID=UPI002417A4AE|nr:hypothetical protein [Asanoa sp. WMMD1127]MDG4821969.1 hypothetical protein [Asanoa sp. WMMD1127]
MGLTTEERGRLRAAAERRNKSSGVYVLVGGVLGAVVLLTAIAAIATDEGLSASTIVGFATAVLLGGVLVPILVRLRRRRTWPLIDGADQQTRRAVMRAIRAGESPDPRIDDLVVDLREHAWGRSLRSVAVIQLVVAGIMFVAAVLVDSLVGRICIGVGAAANLVAAIFALQRFRQLRNYRSAGRQDADRAAGPPAAAKGD